jgi:hypothetical protein
MGIWRYVNCSTCVYNQSPLHKYPCVDCGSSEEMSFSEWEPKFTLEQLKVSKEESK